MTQTTTVFNIDAVVSAIRGVLPPIEFIPLHEPELGTLESEYILECLESGWISSGSGYVERFENALAEACGVPYAVATVTGTAALHLALVAAGVKPGDEVLVPSLTFVATANAVTYCGATPHFVDCESSTLGIDPEKLGEYLERLAVLDENGLTNRVTGRPIRALVPVHVLGHPCQLEALDKLSERFGIALVNDATEAIGSQYQGHSVHAGQRFSVLSFNGNKLISTGGGGALLTTDESIATRARHLSTTAKLNHDWSYDHDEIGFNYRMPGINAALGCAQLERLPELVEKKRKLADRYRTVCAEIRGVEFVEEPEGSRSNYWLNAILIAPEHQDQRDALLKELHLSGLLCRPCWRPLHELPMYQNCPRMDLSQSIDIGGRLVCIPSSASLSREL